MRAGALWALALLAVCTTLAHADWPPPAAPAIPQADGYVAIPGAKLTVDRAGDLRAVFDATRAAEQPDQVLPALNMAGSLLNEMAATGTPLARAHFAIVFHGAAMEGLLREESYRARHATANPNLEVLSLLKKAGVELYVCGQNLAFERIDPATLTPDVTVAADALVALIVYQAKGYSLLSF